MNTKELIYNFKTNKELISTELEGYLSHIKWVILIKRKNKDKMQLCGFSKDSLLHLIKSFTINNLVSITFDRDKKYLNEILWIFKYIHNGIEIYIKIKFLNDVLKIVSFHPTDYTKIN